MTADLAASPLTNWTGPRGLPDYAAIRDEDFELVIREAFKAHLAEIDAIASNPVEPTWENTVEALEKSGEALSRVSAIFFCSMPCSSAAAGRAGRRSPAAASGCTSPSSRSSASTARSRSISPPRGGCSR